MIDWQRAGDKNYKFNNPELNTYPDHWFIFAPIMLLMSFIVFSLKTRGFSWTDVPLFSLTTIMIFITVKRVTLTDPKSPRRARKNSKPLNK